MPVSQRYGSRRKNAAPKRVVRTDDNDENIVYEKNTVILPKDPTALAEYILDRPFSDFYEMPPVPSVYFDIVKKATEALEADREALYDCTSCGEKSYRSATGLQYHLMHNCSGVPEHMLTCIICQKQSPSQEKIIEHIQDAHVYAYLGTPAAEAASRRAARSSRLKIQMFAESSSAAEELEKLNASLSDYDDDEDDDEPAKVTLTKARPRKAVAGKSNSSSGKHSTLSTYSGLDKPLAEAFSWTFQQRCNREKAFPVLHSHLKCDISTWKAAVQLVLHKEYSLFEKSPLFAVEHKFLASIRSGRKKSASRTGHVSQKNKEVILSRNVELDYSTLALFEGLQTSNNSVTLFVGGPVWAMDWCPCITDPSLESDQYLALSTHDGEHAMDPVVTYHEKAVVQVWNCRRLPAKSFDTTLKPSLAYCILLDVGPVWAVKWCPIAELMISQSDRLGLLALACASGCVFVYALPRPSVKPHSKTSFSTLPHYGTSYNANPTLILKPHVGKEFGQCLCVAWSLMNGCNFIVAGFASGHVALWDLKTTSSLLCNLHSGVKSIYAFHTFRAHSKAVKDIAWCPFDENIFVTTGGDRFIKTWDYRNTDADIPNFLPPKKMSVFSELYWSPLWCGLYASSDSVFSTACFHGCMMLSSNTAANIHNVVPFKAASPTVTSCDWLNCVASGDVAGNACINSCNNWNRSYIAHKKYPRILLYQTEIEWLKEGAATSYLQGDASERIDTEAYKVIFHDLDTSNPLYDWTKMEAHYRIRTFDDLENESYDYPIAAIHKMRWNPNLSSFTWIASGTCSGFLRLNSLPALVSSEVEAVWMRVVGC